MKKISIIVPIYKVEEYLERCVKSLINQTYANIEIILVDDGSPDNCPKICDEISKIDSRIKVIHKENGGLSDARNCGLLKASGDYVLFVDSDDYIELDACERLSNVIKQSPIDLVVGEYKEIRNNEITIKKHSNLSENKVYDAKDYVISSIKCDEWYAPAWLNLYRREFLIKNNLYYKVGIYYEDIEMLPRLFLANPKIIYVKYPFYNYVIRQNSIMTSGKTLEKIQMSLDIYKEWLKLFSNINDELYRKYLYGILIKYYIATARQIKFSGWKIKKMNFCFALKYSLNYREKLKVIMYNFLPKQYIKIANKRRS